jgi:bacteriorhodopsin
MILFTASVAYFTLASNLGAVAIYVEFVRYNGDLFTNQAINPYTRSIWYVRYIDWTITTPLLLLELLLGTGLPLSDIILVIFFDVSHGSACNPIKQDTDFRHASSSS